MTLKTIHAFLIYPGKGVSAPAEITGKKLELEGKLFEQLRTIFVTGPDDRDFEVTFKPTGSGAQQNDCRDQMIAYVSKASKAHGHAIAQRLQNVTDNRSGIGLLFLMKGTNGLKNRLVVSRFAADQAILAEIGASGLDLQFLDQVFIRRMSAYKAMLLEHKNPTAGFWTGAATDRQAGGSAENISQYWITDFLNADFAETPAAGTRRLADALKKAIKANPNIEAKSQIAAAVTLATSVMSNQPTTVSDFCDYFGFSANTKSAVINQLSKPSLATKKFNFDRRVFEQTVPYRTVEVENGAMLTAPSGEFDDVFQITKKKGDIVEFKTEGRVADERLVRR
jgi:hypothetical protein